MLFYFTDLFVRSILTSFHSFSVKCSCFYVPALTYLPVPNSKQSNVINNLYRIVPQAAAIHFVYLIMQLHRADWDLAI